MLPGTINLTRKNPKEWVRYTHPEGAQYFCYRHALFLVYTDANLYDSEILSKTEEFLRQVVGYVSRNEQKLHVVFDTKTIDLVMDVTYSGSELVCGYYFAHHPNQMIFWVDKFPASRRLWGDVKGVTSEQHILHAMQAQYWEHRALFPCSHPLSQETVDQARDILIHAIGDTSMSNTAICPYSTSEVERMLAIIPSTVSGEKNPGLSRTVYRILKAFAAERFFHFHGETVARLDFRKSAYNVPNSGSPRFASRWFRFVSALCFYAPHQHLKHIRDMFTDNLLNYPRWQQFNEKMVAEWTEVTLYSTVVLNANTAFLSVQSVDSNPADSPNRIAVYITTFASLGSITTGLLLLRMSKSKDVKRTLNLVKNDTGCMQMAVLHSLPYAFLLWSLISFTAAFCLVCFIN
ncbi:hypothetical protein BDP27DRAFT_759491 [Rhodocollybia butyracea]|uniref:Uncharacterized protein n=1 Tax=Rhodocollybia butyracea TaxID=206335 RepID=A0A9P5P247_9AGAR|nr:hypothetical protein BDP27DRAFT_759491 [Rhodocollybia butyracea]